MLNSCTSIGWIHAVLLYGFVVGRRNVARCSGVETSNANISFPEHFEGKRQSAEMYQKDCLPLLSTFCKFQRLKVKGSQVMLVCLHQPRRSGNVDDNQTSTMCWLSSDSETPLWQPHIHLCVIVLHFTHGDFGTVCRSVGLSSVSLDRLTVLDRYHTWYQA